MFHVGGGSATCLGAKPPSPHLAPPLLKHKLIIQTSVTEKRRLGLSKLLSFTSRFPTTLKFQGQFNQTQGQDFHAAFKNASRPRRRPSRLLMYYPFLKGVYDLMNDKNSLPVGSGTGSISEVGAHFYCAPTFSWFPMTGHYRKV